MLLLILVGKVMADKSKPWSKKDPLVFSLIVAICILVLCFIVTGFTDKGGVFARFLGTIDKKTTIESIAFIMSGVIASIVAVAIYRRAEAQAASAEAQAASAKAQAESAKAQTANNELIAKRHIYERAQYAIGNLGNALPRPRILSFYQLFYLALESQDEDNNFKQSILDMFCVYLRNMTADESYEGEKNPTRECQILLNLVFRSGDPQVFEKLRANLERCHFVGAEFMYAKSPNDTRFRYANLKRADFTEASMADISFHNADLSEANLSEANFSKANLSCANLSCANLWWANLVRANLFKARLQDANLVCANLSRARLQHADLVRANLSRARLQHAHLVRANLSGARLQHADLVHANFQGAKLKSEQLQDVLSFDNANFRGTGIKLADLPSDKGTPITDE